MTLRRSTGETGERMESFTASVLALDYNDLHHGIKHRSSF